MPLPAALSVSVKFGMVLEKRQGERPDLFPTERITAEPRSSNVYSNAFDIKMVTKKEQI